MLPGAAPNNAIALLFRLWVAVLEFVIVAAPFVAALIWMVLPVIVCAPAPEANLIPRVGKVPKSFDWVEHNAAAAERN